MLCRSRLQKNLVLAFVLSLLIPTAVIVFYSVSTTSNILIGKITTEELQSISSEATIIKGRLLSVSSDVLYLSEVSSIRSYIPILGDANSSEQPEAKEAIAFLRTFLGRSPQYKDVSILDVGGREVLHVANNWSGTGTIVIPPGSQTQAGFPYYQLAIAMPVGQAYLSLVDLMSTDGKIDRPYVPFIHGSLPLRADNGSIRGILVLRALLQPIVEDKFFQDQSSRTYLVDNDGSYLAHPEDYKLYNRMLKNGFILDKDQPNDLRLLYASDQGSLLASKDEPDSLQVFTHITLPGQPDIRWLLIRQKAIRSILAEVNNAQLVIIVIAAVSVLIAILLSFVLTSNIVGPVQQLASVADAVSQGDWDRPIPKLNPRDEIGHLATAFDRMLHELRALYTDLENRVHARTAELEDANELLKVAQKRAEHASKAKSEFLSNISHELRTPLNVIIGYSNSMLNVPEMFDQVALPPVYAPYIRLIETSGQHLLGLINDMLDLSKIESGKLELRLTCLNLTDIFQGVISTSVGLIKDKPVRIQPDFPDDLPYVWADPLRIRQILLNLMSNAVRHTETGSITLSARVVEGSVLISVVDTGIGIPKKALNTIFDRFNHAERNAGKNSGGAGLGLSISKQLSLLHGSDLAVQSVLGQGSTFTFTLPLATADQLKSEQKSERIGNAATIFDRDSVAPARGAVVVLAESDTAIREQIHYTLEKAGHIVVDTNDGAQAVELASGLLPTMLVLNAELPSLSGYEVINKLRSEAETKAIPIIIIAGDKGQLKIDDEDNIWQINETASPGKLLEVVNLLAHPESMTERLTV